MSKQTHCFRITHQMPSGAFDTFLVNVSRRRELRKEIGLLAAARQTESTVGLTDRSIGNLAAMAWTMRYSPEALPYVLGFREKGQNGPYDKIFVEPVKRS